MSSYFPIPNELQISSKDQLTIKTSITVSNFPNNCLFKNIKKAKKEIFYCIYYLKKNKWIKYDQIKCKYGEFIEIKRENLKIPSSSFAVLVPSSNVNNPIETEILINPYSLRLDKAPIEERASYNFSLKNMISCYQGEYPYKLSQRTKASFFTFDSLRLDLEKNTKTYLLLINLNQNANVRNKNQVKIYQANTKKLLKEINIKSNSCRYIALPKTRKELIYKDPLFISCNTNTFIPLYLSLNLNKENYEISVEHTHPPSELFWGNERYKSIEKLKSKWIL